MAGLIDRVTTTNAYGTTPQTGCIQNLWTGKGGNYTIANASVFYQLQYGGYGEDTWTDEAYSGPSTGTIPPGCTGIRFRSYAAGVAAVVFAAIAEGKEPTLSGQQFAGTVSASGQVIPPSLNVQVQNNGVLVGQEPILDFLPSLNFVWAISDDVAGTRITITPVAPGQPLAVTNFSANVTINATTEGTADTIATAPAFVFDGATQARIELFSPDSQLGANAAGNALVHVLYDNGASIGLIGQQITQTATQVDAPVLMGAVFTPSAASHTYSWRAYRTNAACIVVGGAGGAGAFRPGYIRVLRA